MERDLNAAYDFLDEWKIVVYTTPTIVSQHILANTIIAATPSNLAKFTYTFNALNTTTQLWISIYGIVPPYVSLTNTSTSYLGYTVYFFGNTPGQINPGLAYNAILGILLFLVFLGVAYINEVVAAFGMPIVIIMGQFIGIFQFTCRICIFDSDIHVRDRLDFGLVTGLIFMKNKTLGRCNIWRI